MTNEETILDRSPLQIVSSSFQIGLVGREADKGLKQEVFRRLVMEVAEKIVSYYGIEKMTQKVDNKLVGGTNFELEVYVGTPAEIEEYARAKARLWIELANATAEVRELEEDSLAPSAQEGEAE